MVLVFIVSPFLLVVAMQARGRWDSARWRFDPALPRRARILFWGFPGCDRRNGGARTAMI